MEFNDIEKARIKRCMVSFMEKRRPPIHMRSGVDLCYEIGELCVYIKQIRHGMGRTLETTIAKIALDRTQNGWKLFWVNKRGELVSLFTGFVPTFSDAIKYVEEDLSGCFFG